jgi:hypothetical protein
MQKRFDGGGLRLGELLDDSYTCYFVTYRSGELTISGVMNVTKGDGRRAACALAPSHIQRA